MRKPGRSRYVRALSRAGFVTQAKMEFSPTQPGCENSGFRLSRAYPPPGKQRIEAYGHCPCGGSKPTTSLIGMIGSINLEGLRGP
jgi:hypothetical protein